MTFDWRPDLERYRHMQHPALRLSEADTGTMTVLPWHVRTVPWNIRALPAAVPDVRPWWLRLVRRRA